MSGRTRDNLLMIATRAPRPGETKTRLGRTIGMERAALLYTAFLRDIAARLVPDGDAPYDVAWTHSPPHIDFRAVLRAAIGPVPDDLVYVPQLADEDWARRQSALLRWGHDHGYRRSVLIASDSPQVDPAAIHAAFAALTTHDVVIGRVHDGGYYLIGQRGFHDILVDVPMSTASAADGVVAGAERAGLRVAEVTQTFDVDVEADLALLREHLAACDGRDAPETWRALRELGLLEG